RGSIAFVDVSAGRAGARGVARVNRDDWHTGESGLWAKDCAVFNFPVATSAQAHQVFEGIGLLGRIETKVRDSVVDIHVTPLLLCCLAAYLAGVIIPVSRCLACFFPAC